VLQSLNADLNRETNMKLMTMAGKTCNACAGLLAVLSTSVFAQPKAEPFRTGAYENQLGNQEIVCVTSAHMASMTAKAWEQKMPQRNKDCKLTNAEQPMTGLERWAATCAERSNTKLNYRYNLQVDASGGKLMIDSKITDAASDEIKLKSAFLGNFKGACTADTPALAPWDYLDLPAAVVYSPAEDKARKETAVELVRCGNILNLMARVTKSGRASEMQTSAAFMLQSALEFFNGDVAAYSAEVNKSVESLAKEFAGKTPKQASELMAPCANYLSPEGVAQAVRSKMSSTGK
jgi:hypothetical protein